MLVIVLPDRFSYLPYRVKPRKSLALIQIEERAIAELENLYSANSNPDEFITVERCIQTSKLVHTNKVYKSQHSQESPWGKEQVSKWHLV